MASLSHFEMDIRRLQKMTQKMITTFDCFYKKSGDEVSMHYHCLECE